MLNSNLNEYSTNVSPTQSPKKSTSNLPISEICMSYFNFNSKKNSEEKKIFSQKETFLEKLRKIGDVKLGEKSLIKKKITKDLIKKQIEKKIALLDFDFLVGEILNKVINKNNPKSVSSGKKKIKVGLKQKKIKKNNEFRIPNYLEGQKSKFYILFIFLILFLDEISVKNFEEVQKNIKENQMIDNSKEIKLSEKVKKSSKEFKEKNKLNEIKRKKNLKSKNKFCELSEEFFSEKITEVSL